MSNIGPEIAGALIGLEVEISNQQIDAAAIKAAQQFNKTFAQAQKSLAARDKGQQTAAAASIAQAFGGIGKQLSIVTPQLTAFQKIQNSITTTMTRFGGSMTAAAVGVGALTAAAVGLTAAFAKTAGDFQELEQGINAIITNSDTANTNTEKFIGSLRSLALASGRSSIQLANTGRQFLALGFSGDDTTKILETFTKAAALTGATNQQLSLALTGVSQIASKGAVSMEELRRQIAENLPGAVNLSRFFEILAQNMGITVTEAKKLQQQGLIGADVGIKALLQTVNETTEGIDVFALRARTLNGTLGILKEGFTQAVQTGFQPFIKAITDASSGPLGQLIQDLQGGQSVISGFNDLIERFGKTMGDTFVKVANQLLPLIPGLADLFVNLTEAISPIIVDIAEIAGTIGRILVPAFNIAASALNVLFNDLGPVSDILVSLASGVVLAGIVNGFNLFGRALGSVGGLLGRVTTPLTKVFQAFADFSGPIGSVTTAFGLFGDLLNPIINSVTNLRTAFIALGIAVLALNFKTVIASVTSLIGVFGRLITTVRTTTVAMGGLRNALLLSGVAVAAGVAINGIIEGFERAKKAGQELQEQLTQGIQPNNLGSLDATLAAAQAKLDAAKKRFGANGGLLGAIVGTQQAFNPFTRNTVQEAQSELTGATKAVEELARKSGSAHAVLDAVFAQTGATAKQVNDAITNLEIDITNISGDKVPELISKLVNGLKQSADEAGTFGEKLTAALTSTLDKTQQLEKAQKGVTDAQKALANAIKAESRARQDLVDAIDTEAKAKEKLQEITDNLVKLEAERAKILSDTTADIREIARAQRDLEDIGFKLLDLDQERADTLNRIKELSTGPTADEITTADNKIIRATLALNDAKREEQRILDELNKTQESSIDLSGLTLDQLRTRLAGIRTSLNAQRAITKTGKTQEELQDELTEAHLDTVDAQIDLNEAIQDRADLDNKVINNLGEIASLTNHLKEIENTRLNTIDSQITAQQHLNELLAGNTTQAGEIKKIDDEIKNLKVDQKNATNDIQVATADIQIKQDAIKTATQDIRDAETEIRTAKADQKILTAQILGDEQNINQALLDRIGLNTTLRDQAGQILAQQIITSLPNAGPQLDEVQRIVGAPISVRGSSQPFANKLSEIILNNPNKLRDLLRALGISGFEQGGLITHPQLVMAGERFKHEMVLPLSKPDRVWNLMSRTLPRYPGALAAAQKAISAGPVANVKAPANLGSGGRRVVSRDDGPATYGQIQELIQAIREQRTEVHVDAPITVENNGSDQLLLRKLSRQLKREILDELGKR